MNVSKKRNGRTTREDDTMTCNRKQAIQVARVLAMTTALVGMAMQGCQGCSPPHPPLTATQELQLVVTRLQQTGALPDTLVKPFQQLANDLWNQTVEIGKKQLVMAGRDPGEFLGRSDADCFKGGCESEVRFKNRESASIFGKDLMVVPEAPVRKWPGDYFRSPPFPDRDGAVKVTWGLLVDPERAREVVSLANDHPSAHGNVGPGERQVAGALQ